jgi:hypothetical protein
VILGVGVAGGWRRENFDCNRIIFVLEINLSDFLRNSKRMSYYPYGNPYGSTNPGYHSYPNQQQQGYDAYGNPLPNYPLVPDPTASWNNGMATQATNYYPNTAPLDMTSSWNNGMATPTANYYQGATSSYYPPVATAASFIPPQTYVASTPYPNYDTTYPYADPNASTAAVVPVASHVSPPVTIPASVPEVGMGSASVASAPSVTPVTAVGLGSASATSAPTSVPATAPATSTTPATPDASPSPVVAPTVKGKTATPKAATPKTATARPLPAPKAARTVEIPATSDATTPGPTPTPTPPHPALPSAPTHTPTPTVPTEATPTPVNPSSDPSVDLSVTTLPPPPASLLDPYALYQQQQLQLQQQQYAAQQQLQIQQQQYAVQQQQLQVQQQAQHLQLEIQKAHLQQVQMQQAQQMADLQQKLTMCSQQLTATPVAPASTPSAPTPKNTKGGLGIGSQRTSAPGSPSSGQMRRFASETGLKGNVGAKPALHASSPALGTASQQSQISAMEQKKLAKRIGKLFVDEIGFSGTLKKLNIGTDELIGIAKQGAPFRQVSRSGKRTNVTVSLGKDGLVLVVQSGEDHFQNLPLVDFDEIRLGQKTTAFERLKDSSCKNFSFSLVYGLETLDLIAENEDQFAGWIASLNYLISRKKEENSERSFVAEQWHKCAGNARSIPPKQVQQLLQQINIKSTTESVKEVLSLVDSNDNGMLDFNEFIQLIKKLRERKEVTALFEIYSKDKQGLTAEDIERFLRIEQNVSYFPLHIFISSSSFSPKISPSSSSSNQYLFRPNSRKRVFRKSLQCTKGQRVWPCLAVLFRTTCSLPSIVLSTQRKRIRYTTT